MSPHKALDLENTSRTVARRELGMSDYRAGDRNDCKFVKVVFGLS